MPIPLRMDIKMDKFMLIKRKLKSSHKPALDVLLILKRQQLGAFEIIQGDVNDHKDIISQIKLNNKIKTVLTKLLIK